MASIYGFTEVLLTQDLDEASRKEFLAIIFRQAELMASILNELLDLARIEARRGKDFQIEETQAQKLVLDVVAGFKPPPGRAAPTLNMPHAPLVIVVDRQKAAQAIVNVLSNAYKYSGPGTSVSISAQWDGDALNQPGGGAPQVAIRIADQGIGMTPEQCARVSERFYRADASGAIPGSGLGMSIVQEIVELHHGKLQIESQAGQGTTVTLLFPSAVATP
jgi:signal transduction histidine kinase